MAVDVSIRVNSFRITILCVTLILDQGHAQKGSIHKKKSTFGSDTITRFKTIWTLYCDFFMRSLLNTFFFFTQTSEIKMNNYSYF